MSSTARQWTCSLGCSSGRAGKTHRTHRRKDMVVNPTVDATANMQMTQSQQANALGGIISGIQSLVNNIGNLQMKEGDIVIPVYLGGTQIDEVVLSAQNRRSLRSGATFK